MSEYWWINGPSFFVGRGNRAGHKTTTLDLQLSVAGFSVDTARRTDDQVVADCQRVIGLTMNICV